VTWPLLRGQIVQADIGLDVPKLFVVISNNRRNERLPQVLTARVTTSAKPDIPSIVSLSADEVVTGSVVCDDIVEIYQDEVRSVRGALSRRTVRAVNAGLAAALGLHD
jgi:mRNA interferase MazF